MNQFGHVLNMAAALDRQYRFGNQVTGARPHDPTADKKIGFGIDEPACQSIGASQRLGATAGSPRIDGRANFPLLLLGL